MFKVLKLTSEVIFVRNKDQFLEIPAQYVSFPVNVGDMVEIFSNGENQYIVQPYKVEKRRDKKQVWLYFTSTLFVLILCAIGMSILFLFPLESSKSFLNLDNSGKNVNSSTKKGGFRFY